LPTARPVSCVGKWQPYNFFGCRPKPDSPVLPEPKGSSNVPVFRVAAMVARFDRHDNGNRVISCVHTLVCEHFASFEPVMPSLSTPTFGSINESLICAQGFAGKSRVGLVTHLDRDRSCAIRGKSHCSSRATKSTLARPVAHEKCRARSAGVSGYARRTTEAHANL
jgi:hypothetical protein